MVVTMTSKYIVTLFILMILTITIRFVVIVLAQSVVPGA